MRYSKMCYTINKLANLIAMNSTLDKMGGEDLDSYHKIGKGGGILGDLEILAGIIHHYPARKTDKIGAVAHYAGADTGIYALQEASMEVFPCR